MHMQHATIRDFHSTVSEIGSVGTFSKYHQTLSLQDSRTVKIAGMVADKSNEHVVVMKDVVGFMIYLTTDVEDIGMKMISIFRTWRKIPHGPALDTSSVMNTSLAGSYQRRHSQLWNSISPAWYTSSQVSIGKPGCEARAASP